MSYTPINWQTGDVITAEKLNKMDNGWSVENTQLFNETATTVSDGDTPYCMLAYANIIDADAINVTFNGTEYTCDKQTSMMGDSVYGGKMGMTMDFSEYPFIIVSNSLGENTLYTENAGTYTISASTEATNISDGFSNVVQSVVGATPLLCVSGSTTYGEMDSAVSAGRLLYFQTSSAYGKTTYIISHVDVWLSGTGAEVTFFPEASTLHVWVDTSGVFSVEYV